MDSLQLESPARVEASGAERILFVAVSPKYGGAEKHLLALIESFRGSGHRLMLLCTGPDVFSERLTREARGYVTVCRQPGIASFRDWYRVFREIRPAVVVLVKTWTWCLPWYTLCAARLAGIAGRFSIVHLAPQPRSEGGVRWLEGWRYRLSHRRLALCSTGDICVSESLRRRLVDDCGYPASRTITISNGVVLQEFTPDQRERDKIRGELGVGAGETVLLCVASLIEQKRVDVLLAAVAQLVAGGIRFRCIILGDGVLRPSLETRASELGLTGCVDFLGFQQDVRAYMRAADVFVLTSDNEGLPLSILEAMACGLPCVVTNAGGSAEAVDDGVTGYVLPRGEPRAIAQRLLELIGQPERRASLSAAARQQVREKYDMVSTMSRIRNLILSGSN